MMRPVPLVMFGGPMSVMTIHRLPRPH